MLKNSCTSQLPDLKKLPIKKSSLLKNYYARDKKTSKITKFYSVVFHYVQYNDSAYIQLTSKIFTRGFQFRSINAY